MPINTPHSEYTKFSSKVKRVRDCYDGSDAVKESGTENLPKLDGQSTTKYNAYKQRGLFLPVVKPTATAFIGAIMRKQPIVEAPNNILHVIEDTNNEGRDLVLLASKCIKEQLIGGRVGGLVEHDGDRPKILIYPTETIINWSDDWIILSQQYDVADPKDPYMISTKTEYLELTFDDTGHYIQNIWREDKSGWKIFSSISPTNRGELLDYIPFAVANTFELSFEITNPALLEIADINLDHYRLSVDMRHGQHWSALPVMFVFGDLTDDDGKKIKITVGAGSANHITDTDARVELLEFTGAGLASLETSMVSDVEMMASVGAKMMQNSTGNKAAETARIESSGESATLSTIANACEALLTQLFEWAAEWEGSFDDVSIQLNRDFLDTTLNPQALTALLATWQGGGMSLETFLFNLQKGELLQKGKDIQDEIDMIAEAKEKATDIDLDIIDPVVEDE